MTFIFSDLLRYVSLSALLLTFIFEQAGILMHTKNFVQYVWEEKPVVLTLPYFSLGEIQLIFMFAPFMSKLFVAFFFLGVGIGLSTFVLICEHLCHHLLARN